jgi:hypothetical protein
MLAPVPTLWTNTTITAAWLPFPSLRFELLPQLYRRDGDRTYHYESSGGSFVRTLEVNAVGRNELSRFVASRVRPIANGPIVALSGDRRCCSSERITRKR